MAEVIQEKLHIEPQEPVPTLPDFFHTSRNVLPYVLERKKNPRGMPLSMSPMKQSPQIWMISKWHIITWTGSFLKSRKWVNQPHVVESKQYIIRQPTPQPWPYPKTLSSFRGWSSRCWSTVFGSLTPSNTSLLVSRHRSSCRNPHCNGPVFGGNVRQPWNYESFHSR